MTLSKVIHTLTDDDIMQASLKARRAEFLCNAARIRHERERLPVVDFTSIHLSIGNLERMIYGEMPDPTDEQLAQERELEADAEWLNSDVDAQPDPRTPEQKALDEWQAETMATRASDYPM